MDILQDVAASLGVEGLGDAESYLCVVEGGEHLDVLAEPGLGALNAAIRNVRGCTNTNSLDEEEAVPTAAGVYVKRIAASAYSTLSSTNDFNGELSHPGLYLDKHRHNQ